jgi:hypothetical protein
MTNPFRITIDVCQEAFNALSTGVDIPELHEQPGRATVYRYQNQTIEIAIVQKLARLISSMNACLVLYESGMYQEMFTIMRTMDEFSEDIVFLSIAIGKDDMGVLHKKYLEEFFQEEFDNPESPFASTQQRARVPRRRILAAIAAMEETPVNPSDSQELHRTINNAMSGYVHGSSVHILDMYGGNPPKYHLHGMINTTRQSPALDYLWTYIYRSFLSFMIAAIKYNKTDLIKELFEFRDFYENMWGRKEWPDAEEQIRILRRSRA